MTTYYTVNEAFKNGTGDVFFTKDNQYVALSRHSVPFEEMEAQGFKYLTYSETLELATAQEVREKSAKKLFEVQAVNKVFIHHGGYHNLTGGFYEEFPDAYGQSL